VVIATHNERANIGPLLQQLFAHQQPAVCVVLVDDASPDGTVAEARRQAAESDATERLTVIERPGKLGYGSAMAQGIARAREMGATAIVTMDADFSHDPAAVPALILRLDDPADCVVGSRYIGGIRVLNWPVFRLLLSVFANFYAGLILNLRVTDATSGFRAYRSEVFERVDLGAIRARGYAFLVEGMYRLRCAGFTVAEEPIVFSERREGQSKMSKWIILEAAFRPWWLLLLRLLRRF
jgi:dolichol-phosphate mannosyltransferase